MIGGRTGPNHHRQLMTATSSMRAMLLAILVGCGGAQARLEYGGIPSAVQQLHDEGWLAAFREGRCFPLSPNEELPPEPLSAAERDDDDELEATFSAEFEEYAEYAEAAPAQADTTGLSRDEVQRCTVEGRAYHVRHDGSQWRVVRAEVIYPGLHGQ
ncbi:MAG: hypothetical protein AB8H86_31110 [Polyangiales bacterium]